MKRGERGGGGNLGEKTAGGRGMGFPRMLGIVLVFKELGVPGETLTGDTYG